MSQCLWKHILAITWCLFVDDVFRTHARDEDKIMKACYWPNEVYEPCFGGCAEVSCDNPRNHLRPCYPYCEPGCVCEDPYVRDDRSHQCVLPQDCTPTQMGIPIASKRSASKHTPPPTKPQPHPMKNRRKEEFPTLTDLVEVEPYSTDRAVRSTERLESRADSHIENSKTDMKGYDSRGDDRRPVEVSRLGNYFNIVIAPPPIKALQPRKMLRPAFRGSVKDM